jgi:hypothetical protein
MPTPEIQTKNKLLDDAKHFNQVWEKACITLGFILLEIQETEAYKEAGYTDFASYYRDELGREKTVVSRLTAVCKWLREHKLRDATATESLSYAKLDEAIRAYPNKEPSFILAAATTNTLSELREERNERFHGIHEHTFGAERYAPCEFCGRWLKQP